MSDWTIRLPSETAMEGRFHHPQILQAPHSVSKREGPGSGFASFKTLAAIVNVDHADWETLKQVFGSAVGISTSVMTQDYIRAISQTISLGESLEGEWTDHRAQIELGLHAIDVEFKRGTGQATEGDDYYAYVLQSPNCRWDRFIDDVDLLPETTGRVHSNSLTHGENGQHISVGLPRDAQKEPISGYGDYSPYLNVGVGRLPRTPITHSVSFNVRAFVTTPDDWLIEDPSKLFEKDPYMATRISELKLIVAAGTLEEIGEATGVSQARFRELLGLSEAQTSKQPEVPPSGTLKEATDRKKPASFTKTVRNRFVPRNKLAAAFVAAFDEEDLPRLGPVVSSFDIVRLRRLAAGLGLPRNAGADAITAHLRSQVFRAAE